MVKKKYQLSLIADLFDQLGGAHKFSKLDLRLGYWHDIFICTYFYILLPFCFFYKLMNVCIHYIWGAHPRVSSIYKRFDVLDGWHRALYVALGNPI